MTHPLHTVTYTLVDRGSVELLGGTAAVARAVRVDPLYPQVLAEARNVWLTETVGPAWAVAYRLTMTRGVPVIAELRLFPRESRAQLPLGEWSAAVLGSAAPAPDGGITSRLLRQVPVGAHLSGVKGVYRALEALVPTPVLESTAPQRRPGRPDVWYARLARTYVRAREAKDPAPARTVATRHRLTRALARVSLTEARLRGLITAALPGRPGGKLTAKAERLLAPVPTTKARDAKRPSRRKG